MSDPVIAPQVEPVVAAPVVEPVVQPQAVVPAESNPATATEPAPAAAKPWFMDRIDGLTAKMRDFERRALAAEERLQASAPAPAQQQASAQTYTAAQMQSLAREEAAKMRFDEVCNEVYNQGKSEFTDFDNSVRILQAQTGGLSREFIDAALETGKAPKLIYELGKNPEAAAQILGLPPVRQAVALARYASQIGGSTAPRISGAPEPIRPRVAGPTKAEPQIDDENLSMDQWVKLRNKHLSSKNGANA